MLQSRSALIVSLAATALVAGAIASSPARAGVCDPAQLVTGEFLCYGDGGVDNPANVAEGSFSPTQAFVPGSEICFAYDVTAEIEHGGFDRVFLNFEDNLGGSEQVCLAGVGPGDCSFPVSGGCVDFPAEVYELTGSVCYTPNAGATSVTATVVVEPIDLDYQCGEECTAGGNLGVEVNSLSVTGCNGFGAVAGCGDGVVAAGETCDDGNGVALDGCDQSCGIESGALCSEDGTACGGNNTCTAVTAGDLNTSYCYSNTGGLAESTLTWDWKISANGSPYLMFWDVEGGVELFKNGEYDSLWLTWADNAGGGETFFLNDGGLFASAFYDTWSRGSRRITPNSGATTLTVTFWVQADGATSCTQPKAGQGPSRELFVNALRLSSCNVTATQFDTLATFTEAMGGCFIVHDFNELSGGAVGPFSGDGYSVDVDTNQPGIPLTASTAPYVTTQAEGDGTVALEAQSYGNYEANSRLRITFEPDAAQALGMNVIDAGDGNGIMAVEAYKDGELVFVDNDIDASASPNNYITWKGLIFSEPVDSVVLFMIEGGDFFNIDNLVLFPQLDADNDGVPSACDCAPNDPEVAGSFTENCTDGIDNDCDGLTDEEDPDCGGTGSATCGEYADEDLAGDNGGWLTSGNQSWAYVLNQGLWRASGAASAIDSTLETSPLSISEGACDEVFKVTIDYGGTVPGGATLTTSWSVNGGAPAQLDSQTGSLAPKAYSLPSSVQPGDVLSLSFRYVTGGAALGEGPSISRVRLFSDADQDSDGTCDACDCAPANAGFAADCDADDDGYCAANTGVLNSDPAVAGCPADVGANSGSDCNDNAANANPGFTTEAGFCSDTLDNDCDTLIDDADPDCESDDCVDGDNDGYGVAGTCPFGDDCDDTSPMCTTVCVDVDDDGIFDCKDGCIDVDGDGYGVGPQCIAEDCNDNVPSCTTDCTTDADSNGIPDCEQDCIDGDRDGYGVGPGCIDSDCDDTTERCTTDCSDFDQDGIADCKDDCIDRDKDGYGEGPTCLGPDCNDLVDTCTTDCVSDVDGGDGNGIPDCEEQCADADGDGYGIGPACAGPDCDDTTSACTIDCTNSDSDNLPDCADPDDDNDGLSDTAEVTAQTDPKNPDTDGDGLQDGAEVNTYGSDPNNPDTDGEGLKDGEEVKQHGTDPTLVDTDNGGEDDFSEVSRGANPVDNPNDDFGGGSGSYQGSGFADCSSGGGGAPWGLALVVMVLLAWRRRSGRRLAKAAGVLAGLAMLAGPMASQEMAHAAGPQGFNVNHFLIKPGADRIFSVEGSEVAPAWSPYGGVWIHYVDDPLKLVTELAGQPKTEQRIVENQLILQAGVGIGFFDLAELELVLPMVLSQSVVPVASNQAPEELGVSDLAVRARVKLLGRDDDGEGFGLNLGVTVGIPTGADTDFLGDGGLTIQPKLAMTLGAGPALVALNLGVNIRTDAEDFENLEFGQELVYGLGAQFDIIKELAFGAEIFGRTQLENLFGDKTESPLELAAGPKIRLLDALTIDIGAGLGIVGGYGAPDWRIFGGLQYAEMGPGDPDTDGDGIPDSVDQCPLKPEDVDSFQDADGCPDPDNDQDGVLDVDDGCPLVPEDIDGFQDADGCPDTDNDKDGLLDTDDQCPEQPEDKDGYQDADGCPDPDNDGDGILDADDQCIMEPETANGYQDNDGCPDEVPLARVEGCKIVIGDKVYFRVNRATILKKSYPLLNEVARIIKENTIERVDIEGHTDSDGSAGYNRRLSDRRAKSVRTYLIRKAGLPASQLSAKGFGESKPIADNSTKEGKAKNRRVEFNVVGGECGK